MARNISNETRTALNAATVTPIIFVEAQFSGGALRIHTGYGQITFQGNAFVGACGLLGISSVGENTDIASNGVTFTLAGQDPALVAVFMSQHYQGRSIRAWLAFFAADGSGALVVNPYEFFTGRMDSAKITENGKSCTIALEAESELADLERSRARRYTHVGMRELYPNEMGFQYVEAVENRAILWGKMYRPGEEGYWKRHGHWYNKPWAMANGLGAGGVFGLASQDVKERVGQIFKVPTD